MRTEDLVSKSTMGSGRAIVALASTVVFVKIFALEVDSIDALGTIKLTGGKLDWAAFAVLLYLGYAHLTNWLVDLPEIHELADMSNAFGDHPESWDSPNPPLRGRLKNLKLTVQGGFGYTVFTQRISLVYGLHLIVPILLWIAAVIALIVA